MTKRLLCELLVVLSIVASAAGEDQIAGRWVANSRTKGGLGEMLIFAADGSVTSIFGALVDFEYHVEAGKIKTIFIDKSTGQSTDVVEPFEIIGEKLIVNPDDPKKREERTRVSSPTPGLPAIVGIWCFKHYTGGLATWQYTTCGLAYLSVPMKTLRGSFKHQGQELIMRFEHEEPSKTKIRFGRDELTIFSNDGKIERRYSRVCP